WQSAAQRASAGAKNVNGRSMRAIGHEQIPYVAYRWPREVRLRDFSRVIPVSAANARVIAQWGKTPVALRKNIGSGSLIFVGSPIGPALSAGDVEAHSLLQSILTA